MKQIDVVAAIVAKEGKVYATQRGYGEYQGKWEFPGGKIEPGESPEEALVREIREELAVHIKIDRPFCKVEYDYPTFHLSMNCFLCSFEDGSPTLLEHSAARWVNSEEAAQLDWLPADVKIIDTLRTENII